jgi:hypothetical protein
LRGDENAENDLVQRHAPQTLVGADPELLPRLRQMRQGVAHMTWFLMIYIMTCDQPSIYAGINRCEPVEHKIVMPSAEICHAVRDANALQSARCALWKGYGDIDFEAANADLPDAPWIKSPRPDRSGQGR